MALNRARSAVALAATVTAVTVLSGCTGSGSHNAADTSTAPKPGSSKAPASPAPGLPSGVSQATDVPSSVPNEPKLRANVTLSSCARTHTGWGAGGTARNNADKAATYTVTVFFTTSAATVIGTGHTSVHVDAHGSAKWSIDATFTAPAAPDKAQCVLRGVG